MEEINDKFEIWWATEVYQDLKWDREYSTGFVKEVARKAYDAGSGDNKTKRNR